MSIFVLMLELEFVGGWITRNRSVGGNRGERSIGRLLQGALWRRRTVVLS